MCVVANSSLKIPFKDKPCNSLAVPSFITVKSPDKEGEKTEESRSRLDVFKKLMINQRRNKRQEKEKSKQKQVIIMVRRKSNYYSHDDSGQMLGIRFIYLNLICFRLLPMLCFFKFLHEVTITMCNYIYYLFYQLFGDLCHLCNTGSTI